MLERLRINPIIAAVRNAEDMDAALSSDVTTIFLLNSDIFNLKSLVDTIQSRCKSAFIHIDFVEGLGNDHKAVEYLAKFIKADGIISTRGSLIRHAKDMGMFTIQRFFSLTACRIKLPLSRYIP